MTKTEIYSLVKELVNGTTTSDALTAEQVTEVLARMDKDIEVASKRGTTSTARVNDAKNQLKDDILKILVGSMTIPQIIEALGADYQYGSGDNAKRLNSQIVSQALTSLGDGTEKVEGDHKVARSLVKKVAYFSLV